MKTTPTSDFIDNGDGTVTHQKTGLMWQRFAVGQNWSASTCLGEPEELTFDQALSVSSNFAGYSDWQLPTIAELLTLIDYENYKPAINSKAFPNTPSTGFWSSSPFGAHPELVYYINFERGSVAQQSRSEVWAVRLVRTNSQLRSALYNPASEFTDNHDGTVTHRRTGLMWQRCSVGQHLAGSACVGEIEKYSLEQALDLKSKFAGYSDWRLPSIDELASIVKYDGYFSPSIETTSFPTTPSTQFWSSSPCTGSVPYRIVGSNVLLHQDGNSWYVNFANGDVSAFYGPSNKFAVRLVRVIK